jgi:hypothetical protein
MSIRFLPPDLLVERVERCTEQTLISLAISSRQKNELPWLLLLVLLPLSLSLLLVVSASDVWGH